MVTRQEETGELIGARLWLGEGGPYQSGKPCAFAWTAQAVPVSGPTGTLAGQAKKGALLIDETSGALYQNKGTRASPLWLALTTATGAGTYTGTFDGSVGATTPADADVVNLAMFGTLALSHENAVTAYAGGGSENARALLKTCTRVTVVATAADSVRLAPVAPVAGATMIVCNDAAANALAIFPPTGQAFDARAENASVSLATGERLTAIFNGAGVWTTLKSSAA